MLPSISAKASPTRIPITTSLSITLIMGILYTFLDVIQLPDPVYSVIAFLPALVSLFVLQGSGLTWSELNLRFTRISLKGLCLLGFTTILLLPILGSSQGWSGWQTLPALIYAPASGIAQELYFRSSLLPGLEKLLKNRRSTALILHAVCFVAFHFRTFLALPSIRICLIVTIVLFLAGCGWGWQVQTDKTVVWAILQHSIFLMLMSMFTWV